MDIFRMRCFVTVAQTLNLTRAAEVLGITQPAMSVQMRELERETGLSLLDRNAGKITLTSAGRIVRDGFVSILSLYDTTLARARAAGPRPGVRGVVKTGYHGALTIASSMYKEFKAEQPDIELTVRVSEWLQLTNMVLSGELDVVAVERHETELRPELATLPLYTETFFCAAISTSNPLSRQSVITIDQLRDQKVIMSGYHSASMDSMYRQLLANGLRQEQIMIVEDVDSQIAMAASDMGMATMPRFLAQQGNADVCWVPVTGINFLCEIVAAWRPDNTNPCLKPFLDFLARPGVMDRMRATWVQMPNNKS